jgi:hypothetical protein
MDPRTSAFLTLVAAAAIAPAARGQCSPVRQAKLEAGSAAGAEAGHAVALEGDMLVVGVAANGSASVYRRDHGGPDQWGQVAVLQGAPPAAGDLFGEAVAIAGDTILVGAPGYVGPGHGSRAYVFARDLGGPDNWGLAVTLEGNALPLWSGFDKYGLALGLFDDWAVIGAMHDNEKGIQAGAVHFHHRDAGGPGQWGRVKKAKGKAGEELGSVVAVGEGYALVGSTGAQPKVFRWVGATWAADGSLPQAVSGPALAVFGETALVGSPTTSISGAPTKKEGIVHVLKRKQGTWKKTRTLTAATPQSYSEFGASVALTADVAAVGQAAFAFPYPTGSVLLFDPNAAWVQTAEIHPPDARIGDRFGASVAASGGVAVMGSPFDDTIAGLDAGSASVYLPLQLVPRAFCLSSLSSSGCQPAASAVGTASASAASGFTVTVAAVEGQASGLLYFGANGTQVQSWGTVSFQCVAPPIRRTGLQNSGGTSGACDGALSLDFNAWMAAHPGALRAGDTIGVQAWYRDPSNTSSTQLLSEGLRFSICP